MMELFNYLALRAVLLEDVLLWKKLSLLGEMLMPASFLLFSVIFAKQDTKAAMKNWRWVFPFVYILPILLFAFLLFRDQMIAEGYPAIIRLGQVAKYFHASLLIIVIMALMNFESTFRSSSGWERWKIKYAIFGVCSILILYVYILSQRLLYNSIDFSGIYIMSSGLLAGNLLIAYSVIKSKIVVGDVYVSRKVIYSSASLIAIGVYSIIIGLSAQILKSFNIQKNIRLEVLLIFLAALALFVVFYNESLRRKVKAIINRNFKKSKYVHHDEWMLFSTELSKKIRTIDVCESFLKTLADRMFVNEMSLWLADDNGKSFYMIESLGIEKGKPNLSSQDRVIQYIYEKNRPVSRSEILSNEDLSPIPEDFLTFVESTKSELLVPLILAQRWVGLLTLGKILTGENYDEIEDYGLLKSAAAHAASAINNARLFEERMRIKELEAFHRLSSFIVHDLKNTASTLSMVSENAKKHFHDPEFQKDALHTISESVAKMKRMINSLSNLPHRLELQLKEFDLNKLLSETADNLLSNGLAQVKIEKNFDSLPQVRADGEEIRKVAHNLLLNASEAVDGNGIIKVSTQLDREQMVFSISDNGPGISPEFLEKSLFKPFKSTKRKGLGIGLYQCKAIVEAHRGKIEVDSVPGKGSTFSVYLPIRGEATGAHSTEWTEQCRQPR